MDTPTPATPRQTNRNNSTAASTPNRRSMVELMEQLSDLFAAYSTDEQVDDPLQRTIPLAALPQLIETFEQQRGTVMLQDDEKDKLKEFAAQMPHHRVGVDTLIGFIAATTGSSSSSNPAADQEETSSAAPVEESEEEELSASEVPSDFRTARGLPRSTPSSPTPVQSQLLLQPDPSESAADGSPGPRRRMDSNRSQLSSSSESVPSTPTGAAKKRRSFLAGKLSFGNSAAGPSGPSANHSSKSTSTRQQHDLEDLVASRGGLYLGVPLDGPIGTLGVDAEAEKLRSAINSQATTRDKDVVAVLSPLTWPQIRAVDRAYETKYRSSLLDFASNQKGMKLDLEYALRGLIMGPLNFDIFLLGKAVEGVTTNTTLLIDLLVARPPSAVALLRAAYRLRISASSWHSTPSGNATIRHKTLDAAILASASSNAKLKKAWEVVLQAKWEDADEDGESVLEADKQQELINNDLDMLKVALRKGGNSDIVTKILLARSPAHIHALTVEYRNHPQSLTQSIKQVYSASSPALAKMLLHAVENGKRMDDGAGVWRDAKSLEAAMEGPSARNDHLAWRLVRLHWDRPRFKLVQQAYRQKYKKSLLERVTAETAPASAFREVLRGLCNSASLPEPEPTSEDERRLAALGSKNASDEALIPEASSGDLSDAAASPTELVAIGEMSNPPSPRLSSPETERRDGQEDAPTSPSLDAPISLDRPGLPPSASSPELATSTPTSAFESRRRSTPLEPVAHRPGSSSRGSFDSATSSLRHARPIAPARRRRPTDEFDRSNSSTGSAELLSPNEVGSRSGSASPAFGRSPTPTSISEHQYARVSRRSMTPTSSNPSTARASSFSPSETDPSSAGTPPISSIDTTSFHSAPISPVRVEDEAAPSMTSAPFYNNAPASPETPYSFRMRRDGSSASNSSNSDTPSRPDSLFQVEGIGLGGDFQLAGLVDASPYKGRNDRETTQNLFNHLVELSKKYKDSEGRFQVSATSYEEQISDLEVRIDEVRDELAVKRREEKDLRSNERQHLQQIAVLEGEVSKLTKQVEKGRESYDTMKKNYLNQCDEAEKLRSLVAEIRRENRAAEEAAHAHSLQIQQFEKDREILQGAISKLEADLAIAARAQDTLEVQKRENLVLKETIDRLRFDLEEMQSSTRKSAFLEAGNSGSPSRVNLATDSMSKSLGKELARRLAQQEVESTEKEGSEDEEQSDDDDEEDTEETVVTTHRTIHKKKKKRSSTVTIGPEPVVHHIEKTIILADVETQTSAVEMTSLEAQTDLTAIRFELVRAPSVNCEVSVIPPIVAPAPLPTDLELRSKLAKDLGIDLIEFDHALKVSKGGVVDVSRPPVTMLNRERFGARRAGRYLTHMGTRAATQAPEIFINVFPGFAKPYVAQILESSMTFVLYSLTVYFAGFITGTLFIPVTHHHHFAPFSIGFTHGDIAQNAFWGEGMTFGAGSGGHASEGLTNWLHRLVWNGVSVAQRVPT